MNTPGDSHGQAQEAFQTFYQEHLGIIYRYVYSKVGNREEAEDLSAQIFMKAARSMNAERGQQSIQKWLFQVARTTIADYWRNYYRVSLSSLEELLDKGWEGPAEPTLTEINVSPVEKAHSLLRLLPEHYREVLICRFLLNLSIKETAQKLGLTEANVKVLQFRALKRAAELEATIMDKY
ncbi:RNA polymerase sigma factor [Dictyobacter formicarum]|uniref:RNA polymerase sigma factor n=1 Tax=Dictyobacter formicarum TaxID=2778368 RepID=A0ABQ3VR53_9CHLR|nr:sigma-70 family RNA polymerase sigma factor [Dictyobacter formicarum]GHO88430.1 RNA polymerase sigma factor [Dictyobacter formicarum]